MKLVYEDEHGAYRGVRTEFLKKFVLKESNPNFEVYDARDNNNRFIAAKCSRIPDDEDLAAGRYGIDFNRAKPTFQEALRYKVVLPRALESLQWISNMAFAAATRQEYNRKSSVWESFYSYIWGSELKIIWVTPHSGDVTRPPDDLLPYPKTHIDSFTAGVPALCAFNNNNKAAKRVMIAIHSPNLFLTTFDIGDFGIVNEKELTIAAKKLERKYHERAQILADELKQTFSFEAMRWLKYIYKTRGTLDPKRLNRVSTADRRRGEQIVKELKLYGQEIGEFKKEKFNKAIRNLKETEVPVIACNYLFPSRHVSRLLKVSENIGQGLLHSALNIECSKVYLAREPELISDIVLDIKKELFDE